MRVKCRSSSGDRTSATRMQRDIRSSGDRLVKVRKGMEIFNSMSPVSKTAESSYNTLYL